MKSIITALALIIAASSFAQDSFSALELAAQVARLTAQNAQTLPPEQLEALSFHLQSAKAILEGASAPGPIDPIPSVCTESEQEYQSIFHKMKDFAYASAGLNMNGDNAKKYALEWLTKYPCAAADRFISGYKTIKDFAYASAGLNMNGDNAKKYALSKVDLLCEGVELSKEYRRHYDFAYASSGLNMNGDNARKYAQPRLEAVAFVCPIGNFSIGLVP